MSTIIQQETRAGGASAGRGSALGPDVRPDPAALRNPNQWLEGGHNEAEGLANFLAWFSIGLGAAEVVAPRRLSRLIGIRPTRGNRKLMQAMGLREIAHGVSILMDPTDAQRLWARVGGDVLDLTLLGNAVSNSPRPERTVAAIASVLGVTALDVICAQTLSMGQRFTRARTADGGAIRVRKAVTINRPIEDVYGFWRNFENLPRFMRHLESVQVTGDGRSRWKAKAPAGMRVEWEAETVEDRPNEVIAWRSVEGSTVSNRGRVRFRPAPGDRGTEVQVEMQYDPPGGQLGAAVAMIFGREPSQQITEDMRAFKSVMETGEVMVSDSTVNSGLLPAAQPPEHARGQ
jgi:uncharacterized membrane protein